MKRKILSLLTILALILSFNTVALVPAVPVLAFRAPPVATASSPGGVAAVAGSPWA